jgi:hypothetical protein
VFGLHRELLKQDFAAELNNAARTSACNFPKVNSAKSSVHGTLAWPPGSLGGWVDPVLRVVKRVEGLDTELETDPFCELECFAQSYIPVIDSWLGKYVASGVPVYTKGSLGKC